MGQHRAAVVGGGQRAGPGVEELHGARARLDLHLQEGGRDLAEAVQQVGPELGVAVHHRLGVLVRPRRAALDEVARQGERRAGEADQRGRAELVDEHADRLGDVGDVLGGQVPQPLEVRAGAHRLLDDRADAGLDVEVDADGLQGHDDVAEVDRRVDVVAADRLQGDLGDQLGAHAGLEHRDALAHLAVLRQGAPGLPHEPHGGMRHGFAPARLEEGGVVGGCLRLPACGRVVGTHTASLACPQQDEDPGMRPPGGAAADGGVSCSARRPGSP